MVRRKSRSNQSGRDDRCKYVYSGRNITKSLSYVIERGEGKVERAREQDDKESVSA
jgi:hypothetical protein